VTAEIKTINPLGCGVGGFPRIRVCVCWGRCGGDPNLEGREWVCGFFFSRRWVLDFGGIPRFYVVGGVPRFFVMGGGEGGRVEEAPCSVFAKKIRVSEGSHPLTPHHHRPFPLRIFFELWTLNLKRHDESLFRIIFDFGDFRAILKSRRKVHSIDAVTSFEQ